MIRTVCCLSSVGIAAAGAVALLLPLYGLSTANPAPRPIPEVRSAAFSFGEIYPWVVAPSPSTSTAGAVALSAAALTAAGGALQVAANGALQTVNQLGPLAFDLNSVRAFSASQPPPGSNTATANYTDMDQWVTGVAGLASSTGALGFSDNLASWDPIIATHAGVLQTANQVGPAFFNLNVLKAIGFTQAPGGGLLALPNGLNDNFSAVDIGRWSAGIPGLITNTGTTGFVTSTNFTGGPPNDYRIGGLHTTTQVGPMTFDFNFLPSISTSLGPPSISFSLAPDMTAGNTPFAGITPPTPGVVQPGGGLPVPAAVPAASREPPGRQQYDTCGPRRRDRDAEVRDLPCRRVEASGRDTRRQRGSPGQDTDRFVWRGRKQSVQADHRRVHQWGRRHPKWGHQWGRRHPHGDRRHHRQPPRDN